MRRLVILCCVALSFPLSVDAATSPVVVAAKKTAAAKSVTFQMSITTVAAGQRTTMTGAGAQRGENVKVTMRTRGSSGAFRFDAILLVERGNYAMYMRSPLLTPQLPPGKTWLRVDLSQQSASLGVDVASLVSASQTFAPLEHGLVSTKRVGREVVMGRSTTRYRAVIDIQRAARAVPAFGKQVAALQQATGVRLRRVPYDVWISGDGRIRRVRFSMPTVANGVRARATQSVTFLSFDMPVKITAPPRARVFSP